MVPIMDLDQLSKSDTLSKDAGHWLASFLEIYLSRSCFWHILQEQMKHVASAVGADGLLKFYNLYWIP